LGEVIGMIAGALTTLSFFPQVLKTLRTKSTRDLSGGWLIMMITGVFLWIVYGIYLGSIPVIAANVITFVFLLVLTWVKFSTKNENKNQKSYEEI